MALTPELLDDFQHKLAITNDQTVFTDARLDRLYANAGNNLNQAICDAILEIMFDQAKYNDYTAGQTVEKKNQTNENLRWMYETYRGLALSSGVRIIGIRSVPPRIIDRPMESGISSVSLKGTSDRDDVNHYSIHLGPENDQRVD